MAFNYVEGWGSHKHTHTHSHDKKGKQSSKHNCKHFSTKQHMCPPIVVLAVHGSSLFALQLFEPKL